MTTISTAAGPNPWNNLRCLFCNISHFKSGQKRSESSSISSENCCFSGQIFKFYRKVILHTFAESVKSPNISLKVPEALLWDSPYHKSLSSTDVKNWTAIRKLDFPTGGVLRDLIHPAVIQLGVLRDLIHPAVIQLGDGAKHSLI